MDDGFFGVTLLLWWISIIPIIFNCYPMHWRIENKILRMFGKKMKILYEKMYSKI